MQVASLYKPSGSVSKHNSKESINATLVTLRVVDFGCQVRGWRGLSESLKNGKLVTKIFFSHVERGSKNLIMLMISVSDDVKADSQIKTTRDIKDLVAVYQKFL